MVRMRYTLNDPIPVAADAQMTIMLPWGDVLATGGYVEVDDPETVEALRWRGFEAVQAAVVTKATARRVQKQQQ